MSAGAFLGSEEAVCVETRGGGNLLERVPC